jgi:hypothetical protein
MPNLRPEKQSSPAGICVREGVRSSARNKEFEHLPKRIENWSPTSLQQRLVKTGGRLVKHARYYWLMLAEGHLTRVRFAEMLRRIALLSLPAN